MRGAFSPLSSLIFEIVYSIGQEKVGEFQEPLPVATVIYMVLITQTFDSNKRKWLLIYPVFPLTPGTQGS